MMNKRLNAQAKNGKQAEGENNGSAGNSGLYFLFELFSEPCERIMLTVMSHLAKLFHVHIYTGSYIHKENNKLYNTGSLIGADGEVLLTQTKVHLTDFEADMGFARASSFHVRELPIGNIACPVCMDASYFETFTLTARSAADIVVIPIANNEAYNKWRALRGIWPRVQEAYVYGLKSSLNGWIGGMHFTGKAGIFAPISMTANQDGIVAIAEQAEGDELIFADLDLDQLHEARKSAEYHGDVNPIFEANYFEKTYRLAKEPLKIKKGG